MNMRHLQNNYIWLLAIPTRSQVIHRANEYYRVSFLWKPCAEKTGCYFVHMIGINITNKHESLNTDKILYYYVLGTVIINLSGNTMVYLTKPHFHTHQHQLLFLSCVSVSHLTWFSSHTVGCSPCCSLAQTWRNLLLLLWMRYINGAVKTLWWWGKLQLPQELLFP